MQNLRPKSRTRNSLSYQLELFSWRAPVVNASSRAAQKLARRYGLSLAHANTVAYLAGIGGSGAER